MKKYKTNMKYKTMEYKIFKSKVVGIQFDKEVFDESQASQYITDNKIKGGKVKATYDGKAYSLKLGRGKLGFSD